MNKRILVLILVPIIALIVAFMAEPLLPAQIATHWGFGNEPDGFSSKNNIYFLPLLLFGLAALFWGLPKLEVFNENLQKSENAYWTIVLTIQILLFVIFLLMLLFNLGYAIPMSRSILFLVGLMLAILGTQLTGLRRNFIAGIRTPWTIANDQVWNKTHQFGRKTFIAGGLIFMLTALTDSTAAIILIAIAILFFISPVVYSYLEYRKNPVNEFEKKK